jgi:hypothetical protein
MMPNVDDDDDMMTKSHNKAFSPLKLQVLDPHDVGHFNAAAADIRTYFGILMRLPHTALPSNLVAYYLASYY